MCDCAYKSIDDEKIDKSEPDYFGSIQEVREYFAYKSAEAVLITCMLALADFNENPKIEQFCVINSEDVYEWYVKTLHKFDIL